MRFLGLDVGFTVRRELRRSQPSSNSPASTYGAALARAFSHVMRRTSRPTTTQASTLYPLALTAAATPTPTPTPTPSSSTPPSPPAPAIITILLLNGNSAGPQATLGFLSLREILAISSTCKALRTCQEGIKHVTPRLRRGPKPDAAMIRWLSKLHGGYVNLKTHTSLKPVLTLVPRSLKGLNLTSIPSMDDKCASVISSFLREGKLAELEVLHVCRHPGAWISPIGLTLYQKNLMTTMGLTAMFEALSKGACPRLTELILGQALASAASWGPDVQQHELVGHAVGAFLESGHGRRLTKLLLPQNHLGEGGLRKMCQALAHGACPDLRSLSLALCLLQSGDEASCLGEALQCRPCPNLTSLNLSGNACGERLFLPFAQAIQLVGLPNLRQLNLSLTRMDNASASAMAQALVEGHHRLTSLDISFGFETRVGLRCFLQAISDHDCCPDLQTLNLECTEMSQDEGIQLYQAMDRARLSKLRELKIGINSHLGTLGLGLILGALRLGRCPDLRVLSINHMILDELRGGILADVLMSKGCPHLEQLELRNVGSRQEKQCTGLLIVLQAIKAGACTSLHKLLINNNALSADHCYVLGEALKQGALPELRELDLDLGKGRLFNEAPREDYGVVAVMDALAAGKCPHLTYLSTHIGRGSTAASILALALANSRLPALHTLHISHHGASPFNAHYSIRCIIKALSISTRPCPHLSDFTVVGHAKHHAPKPVPNTPWWTRAWSRIVPRKPTEDE